MDRRKLSIALINVARVVGKTGRLRSQDEVRDGAQLIRVLARIVDGVTIAKAFGAPGDWGYETPIGEALASKE